MRIRTRHDCREPRSFLWPLLLLCLVTLTATGCGGALAGDWHMSKAIPSKEVFAIDDAHFDRDGTFTATVTIEGKTAREKGSYYFNGFKLVMRPQAGGERRYNAVLKMRTFEVIDGDRKVILKKSGKREKDQQEAAEKADQK